MTASTSLYEHELSHGKPRLTQPRPTALGTVGTVPERSRDHCPDGTFAPGNQAAVGRSARQALRGPYALAEERVSEALARRVEPTVADQLLTDALAVYRSAVRELKSGSAFVHGPTISYACEVVLAGYFMARAAEAGFDTEAGQAFHDRAMACEQAAGRASTAALAATKFLGSRSRKKSSALAHIDAAGEAVEAEGSE